MLAVIMLDVASVIATMRGLFSEAAALAHADAELKVQVLSGLSELLGSALEAEPETLYRCSAATSRSWTRCWLQFLCASAGGSMLCKAHR